MQRYLQCFLLLCVLALSACIPPKVNTRGHVDTMGHMQQIEPGMTTRQEVQTLLGSPSITNQFGNEIWYYVHKRKEAVAFLEPEIVQQNVTRIAFDGQGVVASIESYDEEDTQSVAIADEITPTEGQELGFFEQILGNVGRFNAGDRNRAPIRR